MVLITDASESDLLPNAAITVTGSGTDRTLVVAPQASSMTHALVTVLVVDSAGGTALESFALDVVPATPPAGNTPPTAANASRQTNEDSELWIGLWELASDAETPFEQLAFAFNNVVGGTVTQFDAWSAIFTPAPDFHGAAGFEYTVTDTGSPPLSATATIDVEVVGVNDAPTAGHLTVATNEDTPVEFSLSGVIGDVETPLAQLNVAFPQVWGGTLQSNGQTHGYRFTPEPDEFGAIQLWFQVTDGEGLEEWGSVTIDVLPVNDAPQAQGAALATLEGIPVWISMADLASDAETPVDQLAYTFSNVVGGTIAMIDPYTAVFTPWEGFVGSAGFDYTVHDNGAPSLQSTAAIAIAINGLEELHGGAFDPELESALDAIAGEVAAA